MASVIDVILGVKNATFKSGLEEAKGSVRGFKRDVGSMITGLFAGIGAKELIREFAHIDDIAKRSTASAEAIQRIKGSADTGGPSIDYLAKQMAKLNVEARKIAEGTADSAIELAGSGAGKASAGFAKLNIDVAEFIKLPMDQQMLALAAGLEGISDENERLAAAYDLVGTRGAEMIPVLLQGQQSLQAEFDRTSVVSNALVAQLAAADDEMARMSNDTKVFAVNVFGFVDKLMKSMGVLIGAGLAAASVGIDGISRSISNLKDGDFAGAIKSLKDAASEASAAATEGQWKQLQDVWSAPEEVDAGGGLVDLEEKLTAATEKRKSLSDRIAQAEAEAARKRLATEEQITQLARERDELIAKANAAADPKEKASLEDQAFTKNQEREGLKNQADVEWQKNQDALIEKERAANEERMATEERIAALKDRLHQQEMDGLTKEERVQVLMKELQELAAQNVDSEEEALKLRVEANEVASRLTQEMAAAVKQQTADSVRQIGGSLKGVNYGSLVNAEAPKQTELQKRMVDFLKSIDGKEWKVEIPESQS